jgi:hypothetical protein
MKKFFTAFFVILGVIFFILILAGAYMFVFDPYQIKPLFFPSKSKVNSPPSTKNPALNASQEKALESIGVDPAKIPSKFTPDQEACAIKVLGEARIAEIKAGSSPTATEMFSLKGCI